MYWPAARLAVAVSSVDPPDGSIGIAIDRPVHVVFTDPLASTSGISVKKGVFTVSTAATLSVDRLTVTLTPSGAWPDSSALDLVASTSVTDVFGRHLQQAFTSGFTTVDLSPPAVTAVSPANLAIQVPLSANVVVKMKAKWSDDFAAWSKRDLPGKEYVYLWVEGVHFNVRLEEERQFILVVMGATAAGKKELLPIGDGYPIVGLASRNANSGGIRSNALRSHLRRQR